VIGREGCALARRVLARRPTEPPRGPPWDLLGWLGVGADLLGVATTVRDRGPDRFSRSVGLSECGPRLICAVSALIRSETVVNGLTRGLHAPRAGLYDPTPGLHDPSAGLYDPTPGLHDPSAGLYDPTTGLHWPAASLQGHSPGLLAPTPFKNAASRGLTSAPACLQRTEGP
jgi:hypothetical protein